MSLSPLFGPFESLSIFSDPMDEPWKRRCWNGSMLWAFLALEMDLEMVCVVKVTAKKMRDKLQSR